MNFRNYMEFKNLGNTPRMQHKVYNSVQTYKRGLRNSLTEGALLSL